MFWVDIQKVKGYELKWGEKEMKQLKRMADKEVQKEKEETRTERLIGETTGPVSLEVIGAGREQVTGDQ